jgi:hypothetical protein
MEVVLLARNTGFSITRLSIEQLASSMSAISISPPNRLILFIIVSTYLMNTDVQTYEFSGRKQEQLLIFYNHHLAYFSKFIVIVCFSIRIIPPV